jgi:uncharacterized membrane protein YccC
MLPQHPVYRKLDAAVTILGIDLEDWFGLGVAFIAVSRASDLVVGHLLGLPRAEAMASALATGVMFLFWRRVRERTPRHFIRHLLGYLSEAEGYLLTPDQDANPYVV